MKRGTKPKPTAIKILKGTQPCRVNHREPVAVRGEITPPPYLDDMAREFWSEVAPLLDRMGVFALTDRHVFGQLCESFSRWRSDPNDQRRRDEFRKLAAEFGLTPSSRSNLKAPETPKDALGEFLAS